MDLYLKRRTAWNAVVLTVNIIGICFLLWANSVRADTAHADRDYLFPAESNGGFITLPVSGQARMSSVQSSQKT